MDDPFTQDEEVKTRRSSRGLMLAFGCLFIICGLIVGVVVLVVGFGFRSFRESEPYRLALTEVQSDPLVIEALGEPIEPGWFVSGSISINNDEGEASLEIPVSGPRQSGTVYVDAERVPGEGWFIERLSVVPEGGERINLRE